MSRPAERMLLVLVAALFASLWVDKIVRYNDLAAYCLEHGTIP